ncbi:conserved Plasmodium membrane protein, unknown function [Plasmodium knowlesi strain H]|uniref:Uncharacterized protein n=2 Tax=Plasmodium knowlesi (strain H) TaxID=5851 RepID=A0A679KTI2_PLAKH|nr:conserved Plasmodium membrane protein, unknown function [Plasmodium knowlesi strain H]CAA9986542.1 conserved Plasmodium membrane protein, unknown function [Plasmodium knowlesi strain H]SBO29788.1 conserved Plasmodium membrane protein, unknown function [Plasmodium knowlesi strain H]VVS76016.1 conserved Plasmodium membrane protein, unknown function [Plasmodium knowlesi strain H]
MLQENLITGRTLKDGKDIFVFNNYGIWLVKLSHLCFFFLLSVRNTFHFSPNLVFLVLFFGFFIICFFFCMSWYSCFRFIRQIRNEELIDEELNPSMLNEIIPQIFFSVCSFLLINILYLGHLIIYLNVQNDVIPVPTESLVIFFLFFSSCILYGALFKYDNSVGIFLLGANGIATLVLSFYQESILLLPSLLCTGLYLAHLIRRNRRDKLFYRDREGDYVQILMCTCASAFVLLLLKNLSLITSQFFSFLLLLSTVPFLYADLSLQNIELRHQSIENRIMHTYVSSFHSSKKIPGTLS